MKASKTTVTEGQDSLLLTCEVDANPPATIEWIKNLNTDNEEVIGKDDDDDNTIQTLLIITNDRHGSDHQDKYS